MASISNKSGARLFDDDSLLRATVLDALRICEKRYSPRFLGFLDERQRLAVAAVLKSEKWSRFLFHGGYPEAERVLLGVFPDGEQLSESDFPITVLAFQYRRGVSLNHRDFLGTILSCGVKRETVGDILCSDGLTVAFLHSDAAQFIAGQIDKVGGEGVTLLPDYQGELPLNRNFFEIQNTVASPRLDAVVKIAAGISREEAARIIELGQVSVNHIPCTSVSRNINEMDILSVRGTGRFLIDKLGPVTRKGRLFITVKKYQ